MTFSTTFVSGAVNMYNGAGTNYVVQTPSNVLYQVYIDGNSDVVFVKSTDGGINWAVPVVVFTGTTVSLSIWYDRWSNISAGLIHCAYTESGGNDTLYRSIDTESSDALGTQTTIFAGASQANGRCLSITRTRGGNLLCHTVIDAGAEGGFYRSTDVGATWGARTVNEAIATTDQIIMLPGWAADNQDAMAFWWDASADEVSRYLYDDSADTWAETSIATSMIDLVATTAFASFAAAVDITNSQNILVAWSNADALNSDLRCWKITESAITEMTNVVLNSGGNQGLAAIAIASDTGYWYVFYAGKSDGTEAWTASCYTYYKVSQDGGTTWGSETRANSRDDIGLRKVLFATPRFSSRWQIISGADNIFTIGRIPMLRAQTLLGV